MQWAERCFDSLRKSSMKPDVYVVDNGSSDGTQAYIQEHYPDFFFLQSKENLGFGIANNIGLQYALDNGYDYVYLLNQDAWVMENTFERLAELSKKNPEYGILSPYQMNADMYHIDSKFEQNVLTLNPIHGIWSDMYNQNLKEVYPALNVMAAHWFISKECLKKVGGFSPSFPHYGEDYNYIDRVYFKGMKVGIVPFLRVVHDRGRREENKAQKLYLIYISHIQTLSNPKKGLMNAFAIISYETVKCVQKYKTLKPLHNWWKILCNFRLIVKNRMISMNMDCAFLRKIESVNKC